VTWNPHKLLGVTLQCSAILVREKVLCASVCIIIACYSAHDREAEYCDDRVCLCVCLSVCVCVCVCLSVCEHISGNIDVRSLPNFYACYLWPWFGLSLVASLSGPTSPHWACSILMTSCLLIMSLRRLYSDTQMTCAESNSTGGNTGSGVCGL